MARKLTPDEMLERVLDDYKEIEDNIVRKRSELERYLKHLRSEEAKPSIKLGKVANLEKPKVGQHDTVKVKVGRPDSALFEKVEKALTNVKDQSHSKKR